MGSRRCRRLSSLRGGSNALRQARALGDVLVVGLVGDEEIVANKGSEPVMPFEERLAALQGCKFVDEVIAGVDYDLTSEWVETLLREHKIDFIAHGDDPCLTKDGRDAYAYAKSIGRFRTFKRTEGISTTDLVGRMLLQSREHHVRSGDSRLLPAVRSSDLRKASIGDASALAAEESARSATPLIGRATPIASGRATPSVGTSGAAIVAAATPRPASSAASAAAAAAAAAEAAHHAAIAALHTKSTWQFLPTSRRIAQFAEGRTPSEDDIVVYIPGSWDLFHAGHMAALLEARKHGTFVLVGIYDDDTVHDLHGEGAPVMNLFERGLSVLACRYVDDVILGAPWAVTEDVLRTFKIDIVLGGSTSMARVRGVTEDEIRAANAVAASMGILREFRSPSVLNSDDIIGRVLAKRDQYEVRFHKKKASENAYRKERAFVQEA